MNIPSIVGIHKMLRTYNTLQLSTCNQKSLSPAKSSL